MQKPAEKTWKMAATVVALTALVMAFYVQIFGLRSRQEEARVAAARLEDALAESRTKLKAEILAELRADLSKRQSMAQGGEEDQQPIPDAVLRRGEDESGAFEQVVDSRSPERSLVRLNQSLRSLSTQMEESDRARRGNLEELRLAVRSELDASRRTTGLILVILIPLVVDLLYSFWRRET
ncbi:MAG TPA: hypothetical protein VGX68_01525 [Thermoanaerobaculia bacterium]|jgi:hypothetical protein|nr:hypothetical protein [Thermoanaerobaculia bacterium]